MALKTLGQLRQEIAENLSILDTNQVESFDATTTPSLTRVNQYINDSLREITSNYPYDITERNINLPYNHVVNNVPSVYFTDSVGNSGTTTPYPDTTSLETLAYVQDPSVSYSGISFVDDNGTTRTSVSGVATTASWTGVGYMYEMPAEVDKIISITTPSNGNIKMSYIPYVDLINNIPQGLTTSTSSTPTWYTIQNGMSASGNQMVEFYPSPDPSVLSGTTFRVHYSAKEVDLTADTEIPNVVPDNFQDITVHAALEKSYALINDMEKSQYHQNQKIQRLLQFRKWCENNPDYVNRFRDGHYLGSLSYSVGADLAVGYMINGFGH